MPGHALNLRLSRPNRPDHVNESTNCNFYAMRQALRNVAVLYERYVGRIGLTMPQFSILRVIHGRPGITMQELAAALVMDRTSLLRALKPLTRDGYVLQQASAQNPRKQVMSLTGAGSQKFEEAKTQWRAAQAEFEATVGADKALAMRDALWELAHIKL